MAAKNDINLVAISGNLARDARLNPKGTQLVFTVAVNSAQQDGAERTDWVPCVVFGKGASALAPYLKQGKEVTISGYLRTSTVEANGQKQGRMEVVAARVKFHGGKPNGASQAAAADEDEDEIDVSDLDDEVPF
jgi:single stranded DNA-binding protein